MTLVRFYPVWVRVWREFWKDDSPTSWGFLLRAFTNDWRHQLTLGSGTKLAWAAVIPLDLFEYLMRYCAPTERKKSARWKGTGANKANISASNENYCSMKFNRVLRVVKRFDIVKGPFIFLLVVEWGRPRAAGFTSLRLHCNLQLFSRRTWCDSERVSPECPVGN